MQAPLTFAADNRLPDILDHLRQLLPPKQRPAGFGPLDQLIFGVLAANVSSAGATASYRRLRAHYPKMTALAAAAPDDVARQLIGIPAGAAKAEAIITILAEIEAAFGSLSLDGLFRLDSEMAMRFLTGLPMVSDDAAAAVLAFSGQERTVLSVGKDTARPLRRLGLCERGAPLSALPRHLIERSPADWRAPDFHDVSRGMVLIADRFCHQGRPDCRSCPLAGLCPSAEESQKPAAVLRFPGKGARHGGQAAEERRSA